MRILLTVFPEPGHLHPFLEVARALQKAGHEVSFCSAEDVSERVARADLRARCFAPTTDGSPRRTRRRSVDFAERLEEPAWARRWYHQVLLARVAEQVDLVRTAVEAGRPQLICTDPLNYAGPIVAEERRIPWVGISTMLVPLSPVGFQSTYHELLDQQAPERASLFNSFSVRAPRFKCGEAISPWFNGVLTTEELVSRVAADNDFSTYLGPIIADGPRGDEVSFPWERVRPDVPLIYVSFGSQLSPPSPTYEALAHSLRADEAQFVFSLNDRIDDPFVATLPSHVLPVRYAPQLRLLERASAMVTHGGANGVSEAIQHGKPMLVIPLAHDQPLQARLVSDRGIGMELDRHAINIQSCRDALLTVTSTRVRTAAGVVSRSYAEGAGARVVAAVEHVGSTGCPWPIERNAVVV